MQAEAKKTNLQPAKPTPPPKPLTPLENLGVIQQSLMNVQQWAQMVAQLHGVQLTNLHPHLLNIAKASDNLAAWMLKDLKMKPNQPMNRTQRRRMERAVKKKVNR